MTAGRRVEECDTGAFDGEEPGFSGCCRLVAGFLQRGVVFRGVFFEWEVCGSGWCQVGAVVCIKNGW